MPAEFGLIAMLAIFISLSNALINSGLTQSLIRTENVNDEDFSTVFYFNLLGSFVVYGLIFLAAPFIAQFYKQPILTAVTRVYCLSFIINAFSTVQVTRLTKLLDFKTQMQVSIPSMIIGGIVGVVMALLGYGVWSIVWSGLAQSLAATVQLWFATQWKPLLVFNLNKFKYHFNYGVKLLFSGILDVLFTNAYTIIIGRFFAPAQVGYYNRADSLQMLPVHNIGSIVTKVSFPLFSSIQNDDIRLKSVYKRIMQLVVFLVSPILLLMAALAEPLFRFLFGETWLPAVPYFQIICFNGILYPIHAYNLQILNVKGRSDLFLKLEVLKKAIVIVVIALSFQFGIYGLLYGSVITSIFSFIINTHYSGKFLKYTALEQTKDLAPAIGLSIAVGMAVYAFDSALASIFYYDIIRLLCGGFLGGVLYFFIGYVTKMESIGELILLKNKK